MDNFKQINEDLIYEYHLAMPINEMAKINGVIEVHNEDDDSPDADQLKFAHFHYKGIHFKFSRKIPKNATQARKMIAFSREQNKIDDHELTELCKILRSRPVRKNTGFKTVYEFALSMWVGLNDRDADFID